MEPAKVTALLDLIEKASILLPGEEEPSERDLAIIAKCEADIDTEIAT